MNIKLFPTLNRGFTTVDSTLLAVCITAGAAVIAAIITAVVKITPSYTLRKDRRERIGRYRAEYDNWMRNVKSAQKSIRQVTILTIVKLSSLSQLTIKTQEFL